MSARLLVCAAFVLAGAALAPGESPAPPDPKALLTESQARIRALKAVRYESMTSSEGVLAQRFPTMAGAVLMARNGQGVGSFYAAIEVTPKDSTPPYRVEMVADAKRVMIINHTQKSFDQKAYADASAYLKNTSSSRVDEFIAAEPFAEELKATLTYVGLAKVGEEDCHAVDATLSGRQGRVRWYLAKSDQLPRGYDLATATPIGESTVQVRVKNLQADPETPEDRFALAAPEGYRKIQPPPPGPQRGGREFLEAGSAAPDFTLQTADGKDVALKDLRGKVVLLDFWATWCGPCRMIMPKLQRLHEKYKDKPVAIYGVSTWERGPAADPGGFMKKNNYTYPTLVKGDTVATAYKVSGIPTLYLVGPDGKILLALSGAGEQNERAIEQQIEAALATLAAAQPAATPPVKTP